MVMDEDEREREPTPSAGDDRSNLVEDLFGAVEMAAQFGDYRRTHRKECNNLVRRMKLLLPLFEELRDLESPISDNHFSRFSKLKKSLVIARKLLRSCNEGSKIYLALESEAMMLRFHSAYDKISKALDDLPYDEIGISDEVKEQVELTSKHLRRAKKRTDTQDIEMAMDLMAVFSKNDDRNADRAIIERLGKKLELHSAEDLKIETIAVRNLMKQKCGQIGDTTQQIVDLLNKFKQIAGVEVTNVALEDPVAATRTLSKSPSLMIPHEFLCPITLEIMTDPVIVASGQSYERESIQKWFDTNHRTCPKTRQTLAHLSLAPNYALKNLIQHWCEKNNFQVATKSPPAPAARREKSIEEIARLVEQLSSSHLEWQRKAVKEVRLVSKEEPEKRALIACRGGIPPLVHLLSYPDSKIQEHAVTALLNLSIDDANKTSIAREGAIPAIVEVLRSGSIEARENSAAALFSLSIADENKAAVGAAEGIPALVELLRSGTVRGKKDAATALFNLSLNAGNRERAVAAGIVSALLQLVADRAVGMVDEALSILLLMAGHPDGRLQIARLEFVETLVGFIKEGTPKNKECAAAVLLELVSGNLSLLVAALEFGVADYVEDIAATGTNRARRKANAIVHLIHRHQNIT